MKGIHKGLGFQHSINLVNGYYEKKGLAVITRKGIPGKYIFDRKAEKNSLSGFPEISPEIAKLNRNTDLSELFSQRGKNGNRFIPEAKAEPDYGGVISEDGRAIFYDAKSTKRDKLDFDNLHAHQIDFLRRTGEMKAISGFLVEFSEFSEIYFLPVRLLDLHYKHIRRKSVPYEFFREHIPVAKPGLEFLLFDYLQAIKDTEERYGFCCADFEKQIFK